MSKWSVFAYTSLSFFFVISCTMAVFYGYKVIAHQVPQEPGKLEDYRYHFVLVPEELDNEYWRLVEKGARKAAEEAGVVLEYAGPNQASIDEHLETIEKAAASKVDGIITQGLSDEQFTPLINKVVGKTPVITIDTDAANSERVAYIGTDNYYAGYLAGRALVKDLNGKAEVAIITGNFYANHQIQRVKGFKAAVGSEKNIRIIDVEESEISRVKAAEKAYQILKEHPNVTAFYGTSALDAIGIAQVVEMMQRQGDIYVMGFDTLPETLDYMKNGTIQGTVVQEPFEMGYKSVRMMIDLLEGRDIPPLVHTDTKILRKADLPISNQEQIREVH